MSFRNKLAVMLTALAAVHCASSNDGTPGVGLDGGGGQNPQNGGSPNGNGGSFSGGGSGDTQGQGNGGSLTSNGGSFNSGGNAGAGATDSGMSRTDCKFDPVGNLNRKPNFCDLGPPLLAPFDPDTADSPPTASPSGAASPPATLAGWNWHNVDGAMCRDGTQAGFYTHTGTAGKLLIYLEGGGACSDDHFCQFNPDSTNTLLSGDGESVLGSTFGSGAGWQMPGVYTDNTGVQGIFDTSNAANPYKDWSQIYVPYCTGDVYFGKLPSGSSVSAPTTSAGTAFVGGTNMELFIGHIVPTYQDKVTEVVLSGASAGGFGAALNASMVMDAFGDTGKDIRVDIMDDSGPPFDDKYMPVCMQKLWRSQWGFQFPADCTECQQSDGGGLVNLATFLLRKHPRGNVGIISSMNDEVIRLFYSVGENNCANYTTADPICITLGQAIPCTPPQPYFPADTYASGLTDLRAKYIGTGRLSTYFLGGANISKHQHEFRARFYDATAGTETIAKFTSDFLSGTMAQIGP